MNHLDLLHLKGGIVEEILPGTKAENKVCYNIEILSNASWTSFDKDEDSKGCIVGE